MDVYQIDLMIMEKRPSKGYSNKIYFYILYVMDVFSRYIFFKATAVKRIIRSRTHH